MARGRKYGAYRVRGFYTRDPDRLRDQKSYLIPQVDADHELTPPNRAEEGAQKELRTFPADFGTPGRPAWCVSAGEPWSEQVCTRELNERRLGGSLCRERCEAF